MNCGLFDSNAAGLGAGILMPPSPIELLDGIGSAIKDLEMRG
jgi:hypothetical protein